MRSLEAAPLLSQPPHTERGRNTRLLIVTHSLPGRDGPRPRSSHWNTLDAHGSARWRGGGWPYLDAFCCPRVRFANAGRRVQCDPIRKAILRRSRELLDRRQYLVRLLRLEAV